MANNSAALYVIYRIFAVFPPGTENAFSAWTDTHFDQGFVWRSDAVSFLTLDEDGDLNVTVHVGSIAFRPDAERVIKVPFCVPIDGSIEVATTTDSAIFDVPPGDYSLIAEQGHLPGEGMWCRLHFRPGKAGASILKADERLSPPAELLMVGWPP